jgi:hypothetical protein
VAVTVFGSVSGAVDFVYFCDIMSNRLSQDVHTPMVSQNGRYG